MSKHNLEIYKSCQELEEIFCKMSRQMVSHEEEDVVFFTILKGGAHTANKLLHYYTGGTNPYLGYLGLSSYKDELASSEMTITYDNDLTNEMIQDKNVWIIDDIADSGKTLDRAKGLIEAYNPHSVKTAVLIDRLSNREAHSYPQPDVVGLTYAGEEFLVGAGMGLGEEYRSLGGLFTLTFEEKESVD